MKTLRNSFGILTITVALTVDVQGQSFLTNGLVAYYPLNGNAIDASGNGNNGTVFGATLASDRFGASGMAYQFDGTNDYIVADVPSLPTNSEPRTISLWSASAKPANTSCLLFWGTSQNREGFGILGNGSPHTWQGQTWGGGDDVNSGIIIDTNWHQIVVVYDGSALSISIDGVQHGRLSESINTGFSPLTIGADTNNNAPGQFFDGAINDVRIYNVALSTNEIQELYQNESTPQIGIVQAVIPTFANLNVGTNYQLQISTSLNGTFTNFGSSFIATNSTMTYPQYFNVANWNQLFFQVQVAP